MKTPTPIERSQPMKTQDNHLIGEYRYQSNPQPKQKQKNRECAVKNAG